MLKHINSFSVFNDEAYWVLYPRLWYRTVAFIAGITFAIMRFEYKYVDRLNNGTKPKHKQFLEKMRYNTTWIYFSYIFGLFLCLFVCLILLTDTKCV